LPIAQVSAAAAICRRTDRSRRPGERDRRMGAVPHVLRRQDWQGRCSIDNRHAGRAHGVWRNGARQWAHRYRRGCYDRLRRRKRSCCRQRQDHAGETL